MYSNIFRLANATLMEETRVLAERGSPDMTDKW